MYTVHFETLGCKLNQIESESLANSFAKAGFAVKMKSFFAGSHDISKSKTILCVVNTCTVTGKAEQKARRAIRLLLKNNPDAVVLVTGCYAAVEEKTIENLDVKRVIAISGKLKEYLVDLPSAFFTFLHSSDYTLITLFEWFVAWKKQFLQNCHQKAHNSFNLTTDDFMIHSRASLKIQDGCDSNCSYCRIKLARGKSVSLCVNEILERVLQLEQKNHAEVILTGVNLSQYKGTFNNNENNSSEKIYDLPKLLDFLLKNTQKICFRVSSLYPHQITDEFCSVIKHSRIRPHFHLSVQSGSNKILQKMHRNYVYDDIIQAVEKLRKTKIDPFIACDIIVGFPDETEDDFELTLSLCTACNFSWIHAFSFSARPDTEAFLLKDTVSPVIKQFRIKKLLDLACMQKTVYANKWIGKNLSAVVEKGRVGTVRAVTENFLHAEIKTNEQNLAGKEVYITIDTVHKITGKDGEVEVKAILF
ncbi:MAG: tRNA (N(6)-L-threonylcarbamoyladenosine(37)-C(2))-methylthiotransferase MtaB [Treponemataceae bacterium]